MSCPVAFIVIEFVVLLAKLAITVGFVFATVVVAVAVPSFVQPALSVTVTLKLYVVPSVGTEYVYAHDVSELVCVVAYVHVDVDVFLYSNL